MGVGDGRGKRPGTGMRGLPGARPSARPGSRPGGKPSFKPGNRDSRPEPRQAPVDEARGEKLMRVAGLPAVLALHATAPERIEKLFYEPVHKGALGDLCVTLALARRPYKIVAGPELEKIAGTAMHGGVVALAQPRALLRFDPAAAIIWAADREMILVLDGVGNPHNLGAIARTAAFLGVRRLVLSGHTGQALPSDASHRVAKGGLERMEIYRADALPNALMALRKHYLVVGTALQQAQGLDALKRDARPVALVLGNEEDGLPRATLAACEAVVTIPGSGLVQSLNVAATAAILMHGLRAPGRAPDRPARG